MLKKFPALALRPALAAAVLLAAVLLVAFPAAADHGTSTDGTTGGAADEPYYGSGQDAYDDGYGTADYDGGTYEDGEPADYDSGYSYVRNLSGNATLIQSDGERDELQVNQPVLVGDRLWVSPGSMAEVLLSDGNLLRIDGDSEVSFDALAGSPESKDPSTALRLREGNVQLIVFDDALGEELPRVDLANASFYAATAGRFRLTSDRDDWAQVVSRRGRGEVVTQRRSEEVRAGFEVLVEGAREPRLIDRQAGGYDGLERWGDGLDRQVDDSGYVDESLRYAAAPLENHGSWVTVDRGRAWRPRVSSDWYPYTHGRWRHTSIGLTWVSSEPWGWVPYHYGTWDYVSSYGWVWFPGHRFSPARVHWYWGPSHVAWVPSGYYSRYYGHRTRYGVYGWAGGAWDPFDRWVFCPTRYFGHRYQGRYAHTGSYWKRHHRGVLPRGIVTTDTRRLTRDHWRNPEGAIRALRTRPDYADRAGHGDRGRRAGADLPDVTPYVARRDGDQLPSDVRRRVLRSDGGDVRRTLTDPGSRPSRSLQVGGGGDGRPVRRGTEGSGVVAPRIDGGNGAGSAGATSAGNTGSTGQGGQGRNGVIRRTPPNPATDSPRATARDDRPTVRRSPRFHTGDGQGLRVATPQRPTTGRTQPRRVETPTDAAPRRERAGTDRQAPAQRVLQGVRSTPPSRDRATTRSPSRTPQRPSSSTSSSSRPPTRSPPASSGPSSRSSSPSASSRSGSSRKPTAQRSTSGSSSRSSASSRSSSGGKASKPQRQRAKREDDGG